jgi:hypothetical protein
MAMWDVVEMDGAGMTRMNGAGGDDEDERGDRIENDHMHP